ncbi:MAG: dicarboxylate/amino acid:cation symporter [Planctomycetota bacterium]|nr:dicarboxylate/amino acid:cation symporter [Planctomycetota bacterium]
MSKSGKNKKVEPAPVTTDESHGGTFLGIKTHNWIFVGIFVGFLIGWMTYSLDHHDVVKRKDGSPAIGKVSELKDVYVVALLDGTEERIAKTEVLSVTMSNETDSGSWYNSLLWWYNLFGTVFFMGILKMLIAPLIMASIIAGVVSLKELDQLKRIGFKTFAYYIGTTTVAVSIGLVAVLVLRPGHKEASRLIHDKRAAELSVALAKYEQESGKSAEKDGKPTVEYKGWLADQKAEEMGSGHEAARFKKLLKAKKKTAGDMLRDSLVKPMLTNPFESLSKRNSLGIIFFSLLFGIAIVFVGSSAQPVFIMFIVAELIGKNGPNVFGSLAWYCITVIAGIGMHVAFLVFIAHAVAGCSPLRLWAGLREALMVAFTTRSSAATLPITLRCVTEKLGVSPKVANFGLPVGATMNMDGTALYEGVAVIFLIQIYQGLADVPIELGGAVTLIIFVTAVMASVGAAAVPDAGLVTMVLVANAVGLPVYYIPLLFAVDAFLDMFRTSTNVLGDSIGTLVVQKLEDKALVNVPA